nr:MAG TPA: hypothetical protein [Bacteriophage sp.]
MLSLIKHHSFTYLYCGGVAVNIYCHILLYRRYIINDFFSIFQYLCTIHTGVILSIDFLPLAAVI